LPYEVPEQVSTEDVGQKNEEVIDPDAPNGTTPNDITLDDTIDDGDGEQTSLF